MFATARTGRWAHTALETERRDSTIRQWITRPYAHNHGQIYSLFEEFLNARYPIDVIGFAMVNALWVMLRTYPNTVIRYGASRGPSSVIG